MHARRPWLVLIALTGTLTAQTKATIDVRVDARVELLSIVFRLAENREYSQGRLPGYNAAVDAHFAPHRDHPVVQRAKALRQRNGISYDAVASFAIHLEGIDPPRFAKKGVRPERLEARWTAADAEAFLRDLGDFVTASKVEAFLASQQELYDHATKQMQAVVAEHVDMAWFETFFAERPKARFHVVLGLLNGGGSYGPSATAADGSEDLYAILGCWDKDAEGMPRYSRTIVPTLVHEYCHSYCNPLVDAHYRDLEKAGNELFEMTAASMRSQAYANGRTLLCESLVRACVIRYRATNEGRQAADEEVKEQNRCSFYWAGELADLLAAEYETDRTKYATLHSFAPRMQSFFAAYVPKFAASLAKAPHVVSMTPANGATDVDPATTALVITFDKPMRDQSWSIVGGGEHFPKTGKPYYDKERKVLTVPMELRPDWSYELWLNRGKFDSFRSADGTRLEPVHVSWKTRAP